MTVSRISSHSKMSWKKRSAFDLKQRQTQGLKLHFDVDPYPPMPNMTTTVAPSENSMLRNVPPAKSLSSVLQPKMAFPILIDDNDSKRHLIDGDSSKRLNAKIVKENNTGRAPGKLKGLHGKADNSLIEDILASVNNNFDQVSTPLKGMVTYSSSEENKTVDFAELKAELVSRPSMDMATCSSSDEYESVDLAELKAVIQGCLDEKKPEQMHEDVIFENKLSKGTTDIKLVSRPDMVMYSSSEENETIDLAELKAAILACLDYMKPEQKDEGAIFENKLSKLVSRPPGGEEDDVYLSHRKDAIRVIRSAFQHSRAARSAFLRGDHFSAQQLSHKAREEWGLAEQLHAKAAEKILTITNSKNNIWKLDLHGLHAREAVHALQSHLQKIETQMPLNLVVPPKKFKPKVGIACPPLVRKHRCKGMKVKADVQNNTSSQRPAMLEVVTGRGNHSRGKPALHSAIRSFLIQNGYHFDGSRPGVIAVRPKFHNR